MSAEIVDLTDRVLSSVDDWRHRATVFAMINPIGFYVVQGCTLPQYLSKLDEMEETWKRVREEMSA